MSELSNASIATKMIQRGSNQVALSLEDRFRFTLVICFIGLSFLGLGGMFYISDFLAKKFQQEAADIAVSRWTLASHSGLDQLILSKLNDNEEIVPTILEANRLVPKQLLPENLLKSEISTTNHASGDTLWIIGKHPLIEPNTALILGERDYPELKIAREAFSFQRWLAASLLMVLIAACSVFFYFGRQYVLKPLGLLRDALLSRRLNAAAKVKQLNHAKVTIERLEEQSRFPLEQFEGDEFGQIAFILEDEDRRQKALRDGWLKSFNTINEPIAVFGQNARLRFLNESMDQLLDEIGLDPEIVKNLPAGAFLASYLQLEEETATRLIKVLNQKLPKIQSAPCTIELPEGSRNFNYSISTIINFGERFVVFSLIKNNVLSNNQNLEEFILEQANNQLKIIHRIQQTAREVTDNKSDTLLHMCDSLVDNVQSLLEFSNSSNSSFAAHKVEFNLLHFFRELQESCEGSLRITVEREKNVPTFIVGDPTHLRLFLKGIFQSYQEINSQDSIILNIAYNTNEKKLVLSALSTDHSAILRDPSLELYLSHYSPFLSLSIFPEANLQANEFVRVEIAAPAGLNLIEALELDLSNRNLPKTLLIVSDEILPGEAIATIESCKQFEIEWLTPNDLLERESNPTSECILVFISETQKLKDKQIQKVINHAREKTIPSVLLSQRPRRGESLTALRLGFISYLTLPFESDELNKLLILTMNKSVRDGIGKLGLITKHTVRDLVPSLGKILLGNISKAHESDALVLLNTLNNLGFTVYETSTVHSFFEFLHKGPYEYILCPVGLSTGLKRRIQVSCRDIPCLMFGQSHSDEQSRSEENRSANNIIQQNWLRIEDVGDQQGVKYALKTASEAERTFAEIIEPNDDEEDSEPNLGLAI